MMGTMVEMIVAMVMPQVQARKGSSFTHKEPDTQPKISMIYCQNISLNVEVRYIVPSPEISVCVKICTSTNFLQKSFNVILENTYGIIIGYYI